MPVQKTDAKWGKILEASQSGMKSEVSYNEVKRFYIRFFDEVLSKIEQPQLQPEGGGVVLTSGGVMSPSSILGKRVREVFHLDDEAFILSAIRFFHNITSNSEDKDKGSNLSESTGGGQAEGKTAPPFPQDAGTSPLADVLLGEQGGAGGLLQILANALEMSHVLASQESSYALDAPIFILNENSGDENDVVMTSSSIHSPQKGGGVEQNRGGKSTKGQPSTTTTATTGSS